MKKLLSLILVLLLALSSFALAEEVIVNDNGVVENPEAGSSSAVTTPRSYSSGSFARWLMPISGPLPTATAVVSFV